MRNTRAGSPWELPLRSTRPMCRGWSHAASRPTLLIGDRRPTLGSGEPRDVQIVELRLDVLQEQDEIEDAEVIRVGRYGRVERRECRPVVVDESRDPRECDRLVDRRLDRGEIRH